MEAQTGAAIAGAIFVLANVLLFWIREWYKHKTWNKNGKHLSEIKADVKITNDKVDCIDKKVGETKVTIAEVKTAVLSQKEQCGKTVDRFDAAITNQYDHLIKLAKKK